MKNCQFCGKANPDNATACESCGIVFSSWEEETMEKGWIPKLERRTEFPKAKPNPLSRPKNHKNGVLVVWSVVNMLVFLMLGILEKIEWEFFPLALVLLPGLLGLYFAVNVNNSDSEEVQTRRESIAIGLGVLGTILWIVTVIVVYNNL